MTTEIDYEIFFLLREQRQSNKIQEFTEITLVKLSKENSVLNFEWKLLLHWQTSELNFGFISGKSWRLYVDGGWEGYLNEVWCLYYQKRVYRGGENWILMNN